MTIGRRQFIKTGTLAAACLSLNRSLKAQNSNVVRIGHITDMSGAYRDVQGPTGVACTQLAIDEFMTANPDIKVELLVGDHQNKPDVGIGLIRRWIDQDGIDLVTNLGNSALALATRGLVKDKNKVAIVTSAASSELTGTGCSTNLLHWTYDTWSLAHATSTGVVESGGTTWFFVTADYAFGHAAQADITRFVEAAGGKVLGAVRYPYGSTSDFSSFLLQAQSSGAKIVCFVNSGADLVNCMKQAQEFGLGRNGAHFAAAVGLINDIAGMGLPVAKGLSVAEAFYWDLNDRTRSLMTRLRPKIGPITLPNMTQAGDYSAVTHYLKAVKAVGVDRAKTSGRDLIEAMVKMPTDDDSFGPGSVRADGRKIHPMHVFEVKSPEESKGPGDLYRHISTIPAGQAFRPLSEGGCPLVKG
jgi:branched-chain amino acid transport system substrate-binding protein